MNAASAFRTRQSRKTKPWKSMTTSWVSFPRTRLYSCLNIHHDYNYDWGNWRSFNHHMLQIQLEERRCCYPPCQGLQWVNDSKVWWRFRPAKALDCLRKHRLERQRSLRTSSLGCTERSCLGLALKQWLREWADGREICQVLGDSTS